MLRIAWTWATLYEYIILHLDLKVNSIRGGNYWGSLMLISLQQFNYISYIVHSSNTYLLNPWCRVLLEKLTGLQLVKKFPAFYRTRRFITALTSLRHLSLSWANPIQSIYPHPTSRRSIPILSTHLRLGLPSGLFPSGFTTKTLYALLSSPIRATCPAHLILLDFYIFIIPCRLFCCSI